MEYHCWMRSTVGFVKFIVGYTGDRRVCTIVLVLFCGFNSVWGPLKPDIDSYVYCLSFMRESALSHEQEHMNKLFKPIQQEFKSKKPCSESKRLNIVTKLM